MAGASCFWWRAGFFRILHFGLDRYPHNLVMEIAQAGGIVAVLLLLAWIVHLIRILARRNYYTEIGLSMTALLFGCALFSGDFYDSRLIFIFGVLTISSADIGASTPLLPAMGNQDRDLGLIGVTPNDPAVDER